MKVPAHENGCLWLLDFSPDQVHRFPLQDLHRRPPLYELFTGYYSTHLSLRKVRGKGVFFRNLDKT